MNLETEVLFYRIKKNYKKAEKRYEELKKSPMREWKEVDGLYRVYHQSGKMYGWLQAAIDGYFEVLLELIGEKITKKGSLKKKIKKLGFNHYFSSTIQEALELCFSGNEIRTWQNHQRTLTSALYHAKTVVGSIMRVAKKYAEEGKLPKEEGFLSIDDSIFVDVLYLKGYMWTPIKDIKKRIKEYGEGIKKKKGPRKERR